MKSSACRRATRKTAGFVVGTFWLLAIQAHAQTVINNPGPSEQVYANYGNGHGLPSAQLSVSGGKAYLQAGQVVYGTGSHRLKNMDGQGSYISLIPSSLDMRAIDKLWVLGFRVNEMRFHWGMDKDRAGRITILVDSLNLHNNDVTSGGVFPFGTENAPYSERVVGAGRISLVSNRIILEGISNIPYAAARTYMDDAKAPTQSNATGTCTNELVIREDGTIALQDILVDLNNPREGEPETLLRHVTLSNHYKDKLMFLEIRGAADEETGGVYFDKGQSVCFDDRGDPVSGSGDFEVHPTREGQPIGGWLAATTLAGSGKLFAATRFRLVRRDRWTIEGAHRLYGNKLGLLIALCAIVLTLVMAYVFILSRRRRDKTT